MLLSPATSLCLALLLLIPQTRSTTTGAPAPSTTAPCAPAWCGDLSIAYPFWLAGTHSPECGGHQAFQVTCDNATGYFKNSLWTYRIQAIFYEMKLIRVANTDLLDGACNIEKLANASSVLKPFYVSSEMNQELFFLHGCNLRAQQLPPSWAPLSCSANGSFAWLSGQYRPDDVSMTLPGNCSVSMVPVMAYDGAMGADYQRIMEAGFMLEYFPERCEGCRCPDGVTCSEFNAILLNNSFD